ncbi:hypothetical protein RA27_22835, partial [Ruegeria sp. ANG-R]
SQRDGSFSNPHEFLPGITADTPVTFTQGLFGTRNYYYDDPDTGLRVKTNVDFDLDTGDERAVFTTVLTSNNPTGSTADLLIGNIYAADNVGVGQELNGADQVAHENQLSLATQSDFTRKASNIGFTPDSGFSFSGGAGSPFSGLTAPLRFSDEITGSTNDYLLFTPDTTFSFDTRGTWQSSGAGLSFGSLADDWEPLSPWQFNPNLGLDFGTPVDDSFDQTSFGGFQTHGSVGTSLSFLGGARNHVSPLVIDLDGDGVAADLRHIYDDGIVYFDIDADGFAERVGWTGGDDGHLALDRNGNGVIDDITELYGDDAMPAFDKLRLHDSNADGVLDAQDADFGSLLVWQDFNQDGISQDNELKSLAEHDIVSINLNDQADDRFVKENYISNVSTVTFAGGETAELADVHYLNDNVNTWQLGAHSQVFGSKVTVNVEALLLPQSRGYGSLPALHLAMTEDAELKALVRSVDRLSVSEIGQASDLVDEILLRWAGVQDNDPSWRNPGGGGNIDSRKVDFLEEFSGVSWLQRGQTPLVGVNASTGINQAWQGVQSLMLNRILIQGPLEELFGEVSYDFIRDQVVFTASLSEVLSKASDLVADLDPDLAQTFWATLGDVLVSVRDDVDASVAEINTAIADASGLNLFLGTKTITEADGVLFTNEPGAETELVEGVRVGDEEANVIEGGAGSQMIFGEDGDDVLTGEGGSDFLRGDAGDDTLDGGDGVDRLEGGDGNDLLEGGADRDILRGDAGDDTLLGGSGDDNLGGGAGADHLDGGEGYDQVDYNDASGGIHIDLGRSLARGADAEGDTLVSIEAVNGSNFSDVLIGSDGADNINGERGDDIILGGAGNDSLFGAEGRDQIDGGAGDDILTGYHGAEVLDGGDGTDLVTYNHPYLTNGVHASLATGQGYSGAAEGDTYRNVENLQGSQRNDILEGDDNANVLSGLGGLDVLKGGGGDDTLVSVYGLDHLEGGAGADRFVLRALREDAYRFNAEDAPEDPVGNIQTRSFDLRELDAVILDFSSAEGDRIDLSGQTLDEVVLRAAGPDTQITLNDGRTLIIRDVRPEALTPNDFIFPEGVSDLTIGEPIGSEASARRGSDADNVIYGTGGGERLEGLGGNDDIIAGAGDDTILGGEGNDWIISGRGADAIDGGAGIDVLGYADSPEAVQVDLEAGTGAGGTAEGDRITSIENLNGSHFDDILLGGEGLTSSASFGANVFRAHRELIIAHNGDDVLDGRSGINVLSGGSGADRFVITGGTTTTELAPGVTVTNARAVNDITDFEFGRDLLDLRSIDLSGKTLVAEWEPSAQRLRIFVEGGDTLQRGAIVLNNVAPQELPHHDELFVFAEGGSPLGLQVRAASGETSVFGSPDTEALVGNGRGNYFVPFGGDDVIEVTETQFNIIALENDPDQTIRIKNYEHLVQGQYWHKGAREGSEGSLTPTDGVVLGEGDVRNTELDISRIPDVRDLTDVEVKLIRSGPDAGTHLVLPNGQRLILLDFFPETEASWQFGRLDSLNEVGGLVTWRDRTLTEERFSFNDGTITGTFQDDHLIGGQYDDTIAGGPGHDTLEGRGGNDRLEGGDGWDTFVIARSPGTEDTIVDFQAWRYGDRIDLTAFTAIASFAALQSRMRSDGSDTVIDLGDGQSLRLLDLSPNEIGRYAIVGPASSRNVDETTALFSGSYSDYRFEITEAGYNVIDAASGTLDAVEGFERFVFDDAEFATDRIADALNEDGSLNQIYTVREDTGSERLLVTDTAHGRYAIENRDGEIIAVTREGEPRSDEDGTGWTAQHVAADPAGSGYHLFWTGPNETYAVWRLDEHGAFTSGSGVLSATELADYESVFEADLNNDGEIGRRLIVDDEASGRYGNGFSGLTDTDGKVSFTFESTGQDVAVSLRAYDIDFDDEIEVLLNGVGIGYLNRTANNRWGDSSFEIAASELRSGDNILEFRNKDASFVWGFEDVALTGITPRNEAPAVAQALSDQSVREDQVWQYTLPQGTFADADG